MGGVSVLEEILLQIFKKLELLEDRLDHQNNVLNALQHGSEVAVAERKALISALNKNDKRTEQIMCRIDYLTSFHEEIRENLKDQALDINLLKKIISM